MTDDAMAPKNALPTPDTRLAKSRLGWVFIGQDGLRAGWSILLFITLVVVGTVASLTLIRSWLTNAPKTITADATIVTEGVQFLCLMLAALVMRVIERRSFSHYGLGGQRPLADAAIGFAWGLVMLSILIGLLVATGSLAIDGFAVTGGPAVWSGLKWLLAFVLVGLFEEFVFRGYLQFTLARGIAGISRAIAPGNQSAPAIGFWGAALVLSVGLFAGGHLGNSGETALGLISVAMAGILFAYSLWRTGSLWWAIGFHASWDWAQSFLYGVSDSGLSAQGRLLNSHAVGNPLLSGGTVGPEGSILLVPVLIASIVVVRMTLPQRASVAA
ncbi:MAG: CPBP family intramembrane metalloprotease [Sphingomonas sp.]|nr:CPBP family intramembrane metalloprotease [Sphingomonas sp.]